MTPNLIHRSAELGYEPPKEPAIKTGTVVSSVASILVAAGALLPISDKVFTVTLIVVAVLLPLITAILTRGRVWSPASVKEIIVEAANEVDKANEEIRRRETSVKPQNTVIEPTDPFDK